ncbi:MAG: hypothetical protein JNL67_07130 [Planctomycetaceae bacterium]|nr:hypothetical protein [Planctomycetaceae bacterium]
MSSSNGARREPWAMWIGWVLLIGGVGHLAYGWLSGAEWTGPVSPRKPGLFGVSAGVTVWSLSWAITKLVPHRLDRVLGVSMAISLLIEVGLITTQYWRGVPSHFNRTTMIDASLEFIMMGLILWVTIGIGCLCWRSKWLRDTNQLGAVALRGGLWLLLISCGLGFVITVLGEINLAHGRMPEVWGRGGVLKYPHGAALHAIQTLPVLALLFEKFHVRQAVQRMQAVVAAHVFFLFHAIWQTANGRGRWELEWIGGGALVLAGLLLVPMMWGFVERGRDWVRKRTV